MNRKTSKVLLNGVLLVAMAAVGVTSYQLITSTNSEDKIIPEERLVESEKMEEESKSPLVDADTDHVFAQIKKAEQNSSREKEKEPDSVAEADEASMEKENGETADDTAEEVPLPENSAHEDAAETSDPAETAETASLTVENTLPAAAYLKFSEDTRMEWPVHGNILLDYDMDQTTYFPTLDQYRLNPAISVQAVEGAPVVASADGVVYEITEDPRTGVTVTMELGNGYQAIYGQLKDLTIYEGETVEEGSTIGYINAPTKYYSEEGSNLYFAMKKDGKPIDPILYLP